MKRLLSLILLLSTAKVASTQDINISIKQIWHNDNYCAFTSLVEYQGRYYCSFREASAHLFDDQGNASQGAARIIVSNDGEHWESVTILRKQGIDLRDPKLSIMPDGRLMVVMGGSVYDSTILKNMYPQVSFSNDGIHFSEPQTLVIDPNVCEDFEWVWRVTWHNGIGYGVSYGKLHNYVLLRTTDGIHYSLVAHLDIPHNPGETTLRFTKEGDMLLMARREGGKGNQHGIWGRSSFPYTDWDFKEMNIPLGGPDFFLLDDTVVVLGTRSLYATEKTMMLRGNLNGQFEEVCILPSGGDDNSYTGMITVGDQLWITYYSRHEGPNAAIYLARIPISLFRGALSSKYYNKFW